MVKAGAKTYTGGRLIFLCFTRKQCMMLFRWNGDREVIGLGKSVTAAVKKGDLILK